LEVTKQPLAQAGGFGFGGLKRRRRGVAIFAKAFLGIPARQAAKITRPLMPAAAPSRPESLVRYPARG